jgi:hypothetical protein
MLCASSLRRHSACARRATRGIVIEVECVGNLRIEILGREMTTDAHVA